MLETTMLETTPRMGNILATRTDSRGYTITCTDYVDSQVDGVTRVGTFWITSPDCLTVKAGYWMDWAEPDMDPVRYAAMSKQERAALECWYQVERYDGLASSFEHHSFGKWMPMDTFTGRLLARFLKVWHAHKYLMRDEVWSIFFKWAGQAVKRRAFLSLLPTKYSRLQLR